MLAVLGGHTDIVKFLLDNRCDLSVHNNFHQTAMDIAVFKNDNSMMELLSVYASKPTILQLPFNTFKPSLLPRNVTRYAELSDKENTDNYNETYSDICDNCALNNSTLKQDKISSTCKHGTKIGTDRFDDVYFQFPPLSYNESSSGQSFTSICTPQVNSADSWQTLMSIISPRYVCGTYQKSSNSVKKRQFSEVTSCSTWLKKFVKR